VVINVIEKKIPCNFFASSLLLPSFAVPVQSNFLDKEMTRLKILISKQNKDEVKGRRLSQFIVQRRARKSVLHRKKMQHALKSVSL